MESPVSRREKYLADVIEFGPNIRNVPDEIRTPEFCILAAKQTMGVINWLPLHLLTYDLCLAAVEFNGYSFVWVPESLKRRELCLIAVRNYSGALNWVPNELKTYELCLLAVRQRGINLIYVPKQMRTRELCLMAVTDCGVALQAVPKEIIESPGFLESLKGGLKLEETGEYCNALHVDDIGNYNHLFQ